MRSKFSQSLASRRVTSHTRDFEIWMRCQYSQRFTTRVSCGTSYSNSEWIIKIKIFHNHTYLFIYLYNYATFTRRMMPIHNMRVSYIFKASCTVLSTYKNRCSSRTSVCIFIHILCTYMRTNPCCHHIEEF